MSRTTCGKASAAAWVRVRPGATALQRTPLGPCEAAMERVSWISAALEAL